MINNIRVFEVTQKFNTNGNRVTTLKDLRFDKKIKISNMQEDDAEIIALDFLKEKNINIDFKYEEGKKIFLLSIDFKNQIK